MKTEVKFCCCGTHDRLLQSMDNIRCFSLLRQEKLNKTWTENEKIRGRVAAMSYSTHQRTYKNVVSAEMRVTTSVSLMIVTISVASPITCTKPSVSVATIHSTPLLIPILSQRQQHFSRRPIFSKDT